MQISLYLLQNFIGTAFLQFKRFAFGIEQWWISIATQTSFVYYLIKEYITYSIAKYIHFCVNSCIKKILFAN